MSESKETPNSVDVASSPSRRYLWLCSWFSWSAWYRWIHDFRDFEIDVQANDSDKRQFIVVADSPRKALQAIIVPRLGEKHPESDTKCVELSACVWLPDFCWNITATYK